MSIQIFILSKLMEDNTYPYKLKKQLSEPIPFDQLLGITESKLYYHFDSLAKQGLIKTVKIIKEEHRPDKQVFGITDKGRIEFPKKTYKVFETADTIEKMLIGLASLKYVDHDKVVNILESKLNNIKDRWGTAQSFKNQMETNEDNKKLREFMDGYWFTRVDHTIFWLGELINRIQKGEI